jgi:hypothetical protein
VILAVFCLLLIGANRLPGFIPASIYRFNGLHQQDGQVIHRTRADAAMMQATRFADAVAVVLQVRPNPVAPHFMDRIDDLGQVHFDATLFALWSAGWTVGGSFDTTVADLRADLVHVFREFRFGDHDLAPSGNDPGC